MECEYDAYVHVNIATCNNGGEGQMDAADPENNILWHRAGNTTRSWEMEEVRSLPMKMRIGIKV